MVMAMKVMIITVINNSLKCTHICFSSRGFIWMIDNVLCSNL